MRMERRVVIGSLLFVVVGVAATVFSYLHRMTGESGQAGSAGQMERMDSQRELALALKNPETRSAALAALLKSKDMDAVALLTDMARAAREPEVRAVSLTALGDLRPDSAAHVITLGCRDPEPSVRLAAIGAAGKLGGSACQAAIADTLEDIEASVRLAAARTLAGMEGDPAAIPGLLKSSASEEKAEIRRTVVAALGRHTDRRARGRLMSMMSPESETDSAFRLAALESLLAVDDPTRVKGILCALADPDAPVRDRARAALPLVDVKAIAAVEAAVKSGEFGPAAGRPEILRDLTAMLAGFGVPATVESLLTMVDYSIAGRTPMLEVRDAAAAALAKFGATAVEPMAKRALQPWVSMPIKEAAAVLFAKVGAPALEPVRAYVNSWQVLPSVEEAALWIRLFEGMGEQGKRAADEARQRDPAAFLARAAAQSPGAGTGAAPAPRRAAPAGGFTGEYEVSLHGAIYTGIPPAAYERRAHNMPWIKQAASEAPAEYKPAGRTSLRLDLACETGVWKRVVGHGLNRGVHFGKVTQAAVEGDEFRFAVRVGVARDPWLVGGYGEYEVGMRRVADGSYEGAYTGTYHGLAIAGKATATPKPARLPLAADFRPVEPNEHPRMLFRAHDLPRLRARLATPLGKAAFQRFTTSGDPVCLGMAYQLTGDPQYARAAIPGVRSEMANKDFGFRSLGQVWGPRHSMIALAYDLCQSAWTPEFRREVQQFAVQRSNATSLNMGKFSVCANWDPCSNYHAPIQGGGAMLSLAYWMDPGAPPAPVPGLQALTIPPSTRPAPDGVPVVPLVNREAPAQWLWSGPVFAPADPHDFLSAVGAAPTQVVAGATLRVAGEARTMQPLPTDLARADGVYPWMSLRQQNPNCAGVGFLLHTVVENARPGYYRVMLPTEGESAAVLAGVPVGDGATVQLEAGRYPLLLAHVASSNAVASVRMGFSFLTDSAAEIRALLESKKEGIQVDEVWAALDAEEHARTGMDAGKVRIFERCRAEMYRSHRILMGDGGYQSEGETYAHHAVTPLRYAVAHYNMFGRTASAYPDVTHFPLRYMVTSILQEGPRSPPSLTALAFNGASGLGAGFSFMIIGFPIIPDEYKPGVLWIWNRIRGVDPDKPETLANVITGARDLEQLYAFVNYPLDMKPQHPSTCFPLTYQARTRGFYMFRNRWRDGDDILFQIFAKQTRIGGHSQANAAALRLYGFGKEWVRQNGGRDSPRHMDSVVVLPENLTQDYGTGDVTSWGTQTNGSGHVTVDLAGVYAPGRPPQARKGPVDPRTVKKTAPEAPRTVDPNLKGLRAVAVDYSGACGAAALIAIVDRIEGGGRREWLWTLPGNVGADGRSFEIAQGDDSLRATFIAPAKFELKRVDSLAEAASNTTVTNNAGVADNPAEAPEDPPPQGVPGLAATAAAGESYFVVLTLQRGGPAPGVRVESGEGLASVVRVGNSTVRFDGTKVVIENGRTLEERTELPQQAPLGGQR